MTDISPTQRLSIDQLRILVKRKEHGNPMLDTVTKLQDLIAVGASPFDIESEVQKNMELALRIVCVAGSPAFAAREIKSIRHAIELIGYDQLYSIIATIGMFSSVSKRQIVKGMPKENYQKRCLLIAMISRLVASRLNLGQEETHYMAGLLQECGYTALANYVPDRLTQVIGVAQRTPFDDLSELEKYYIGFSHESAGLTLAEEYRFGREVAQAIAFHHRPHLAEGPCIVYADVGHFAGWIADQVGYPIYEGIPPSELDRYTAVRLNISPDTFQPIFENIRNAAESTYATMRDL